MDQFHRLDYTFPPEGKIRKNVTYFGSCDIFWLLAHVINLSICLCPLFWKVKEMLLWMEMEKKKVNPIMMTYRF